MKKVLLSVFTFGALFSSMAQTPVSDNVVTGTGYVNQHWYSLETGTKTNSNALNWTIAIDTRLGMMGGKFRFNSLNGKLYVLPNASAAEIANILTADTTGAIANGELFDSDETWNKGAFNIPAVSTDQFDYGWGAYSSASHNLEANRVFLAKLGSDFYKLKIDMLSMQGKVVITYAKIGAAQTSTLEVPMTQYTSKNFIYADIVGAQVVDREPAKADWDLFFGKYYTLYSPGTHYGVAGVLSNLGVETAMVVQPNAAAYNYQGTEVFSPNANIIGWDHWKAAGMSGTSIADTVVYFVKDKAGSIWKLLFTEFVSGTGSGADAGKYGFEKTKVSGLGVNGIEENLFLSVYPNPANETASVVVDNKAQTTVEIVNLLGGVVYSNTITSNGLQTVTVPVAELSNGLYHVVVTSAGQKATQKLMIQR